MLRMVKHKHKQENQRMILKDLSELHSLYKWCMPMYNHLPKYILSFNSVTLTGTLSIIWYI